MGVNCLVGRKWFTNNLSCYMRFPTMWYVGPAKAQTSLRIRAVWSEPSLVAWIYHDCLATDWTAFGVCKLKKRLHRLVWVNTCQNTTLLGGGGGVGGPTFSRGGGVQMLISIETHVTCDFPRGSGPPIPSGSTHDTFKQNFPFSFWY